MKLDSLPFRLLEDAVGPRIANDWKEGGKTGSNRPGWYTRSAEAEGEQHQ